ncbi:hypothetical protein KKH56_07545 [bacterium]|nr:hypothetical protein [bacterium]
MTMETIPLPLEIWEKARSIKEIDKWVLFHYPQVVDRKRKKRISFMTDFLFLKDKKVEIKLKIEKDEVLAVLPHTDIADSGDNAEEAKNNLKKTMEIDYEHLSQDRENLSDRLLDQLKYLEGLIGKDS